MNGLNKVILDHLDQAGLTKVAKLMREELANPKVVDAMRQKVQQPSKTSKSGSTPQQLLLVLQQSFDKGQKTEFFRAFDQLVPPDLRKKDFAYKKLEFYLQIYFVVFFKHPNILMQRHESD